MGRAIHNNLELRLAGWRAAAKSPRTPKNLRAAIRANCRALAKRLRRKTV
jgi:hypothetical protein